MTRKEPVSSWQAFWLVFLTAGVVTIVLVLSGPALPFIKSQPADWLAAIGTCFAAFAALWIWHLDSKDTAARRYNEGKIVAHWLRPTTTELLFEVNKAMRHLVKDGDSLNSMMTHAIIDDRAMRVQIREMATKLGMPKSLDEKVERFSSLPAALGAELADALASVAILRDTLAGMPVDNISEDDIPMYMEMLRDYATIADERLYKANDDLYSFALGK